MKVISLLALTTSLTLSLFAASANAADSKWHDRLGSNSLSDEPRGEDAPPMVKVPPSGMPMVDQSTVDPSGNGMARRDHFDIYSNDTYNGRARHHARNRNMRQDWASDETASRSAAPTREHTASGVTRDQDYSADHTYSTADRSGDHYFANYGEDIPALKGLQLDVALNRLHHINQKEIDLAKLAETRAKSPDVLNLAHRIRGDHEALETKVKALADKRNISLEGFQLATYEKAVRDRLSKLNGADFESAFLRVNDRGHEEAARSMRMVRNDLTDSETRSLINLAIPQMMSHMSTTVDQNRARARTDDSNIGE